MKRILYFFPVCLTLVFLLYLIVTYPVYMIGDPIFPQNHVILMGIFVTLCFIICFLLKRFCESRFFLAYKNLPHFVFIFIIILQIGFIIVFKFQPVNDLLYLHDQAVALLTHDQVSLSYHWSYFARYPNNNPYLLVLYFLYKCAVHFGITADNLVIVGNLFNMFCIDAAIYFSYLSLKLLNKEKTARLFLLISFINPINYLWVPYFYTHTCSLLLMAFSIYFCISMSVRTDESTRKKILKSFVFGMFLYISYKIRPTNFIVILAFLFFSFVFRLNSDAQKHKGWKRYGIIFCLLGGIISSAFFYGRTESYYIAEDRSKEFPMTHWIMMASHDIGSFDQNDVNYTMKFAGKEQKKEANIERIKENYSDLGVKGALSLFAEKLKLTWSVGDSGAPGVLKVSSGYNQLHRYITGGKNAFIILFCYAFRFITLVLIFIACAGLLKRKNKYLYFNCVILLGGMLFHCIWEANSKYSICFVNVMMCLMCGGLETIRDKNSSEYKADKYKAGYLCCGITLALCLLSSAGFSNSRYTLAAVQNESTENLILGRKDGDFVSQSFETKINFNTIVIPVRKFYTKSRIEVTLTEENGKFLDSKIFTNKEIGEYNAIVYRLPKVMWNHHPQKYVIQIKKEDNLKESVSVPIYRSGNIDIYKKGNCSFNDKELKKADLLFKVLYMDQIEETYIRSVYPSRR